MLSRARQLPALLFLGLLIAAFLIAAQPTPMRILTVQDILKLPVPPADHRIAYGNDAQQFGDLRLPKGKDPHPVAVMLHGGVWLSQYNLDHVASFCATLTQAGVATWNLEYRRLGNPGGGWPGTFDDVARGIDHLRVVARTHPLDLERVVVVGHSAGGHLALWAGGRRRLPKDSPLSARDPLPLQGVVALAGVTDLRKFRAGFGNLIDQLLGGTPEQVAARYPQTSPIDMLPLGIPQVLLHGSRDPIVPVELAKAYEAAGKKKGDAIRLILLDEAGHFELIAPGSSAWPAVKEAVLSLVKLEPSEKRPPTAN